MYIYTRLCFVGVGAGKYIITLIHTIFIMYIPLALTVKFLVNKAQETIKKLSVMTLKFTIIIKINKE